MEHIGIDLGRVGWTNVAPVDPFVTVAAGRAPFRLEELLALTALLRGLRGGGRGVKLITPHMSAELCLCMAILKLL